MATIEVDAPDPDEAISPRQQTTIAAVEKNIPSIGSMNNGLESLDMRADPDAQATVSDYLDFTEYLPSDMMRSLTLIGKLDQTYTESSVRVHELTTKWGRLPNIPADERPSPVPLRAGISESLNHALSSRVSAHAEALRMAENVNRHYNRAKTILSKLQTMLENYPTAEELLKSPVAPKSPQIVRAPKITLRVEGGGGGGQRTRRQRVPRITVPGEVLAPYELDYETDSDDSESDSEDSVDSIPPTLPTRIKLVGRPPKQKLPKIPRRSSYSLGQIGRSTSYVLSQLKPPPENPVIGSPDAPWLQLTPWELAKLRKRMKKNAAWAPSDTMIARELKALGRGPDAFKAAKKKADEEGRTFDGTVPAPVTDPESGVDLLPPGALGAESLHASEKIMRNRGTRLNDAKMSKRESLAKLAAEEAEESARKMREAALAFLNPSTPSVQDQAATRATGGKLKKRKRSSAPEGEGEAEKPEQTEASTQTRSQFKRTKTETPVPPPHLASSVNSGHSQETPIPPPQLTPGGTVVVPRFTTPTPLPISSQEQSAATADPKHVFSSPESTIGKSIGDTVTTTVPVKPPAETHTGPLLSPNRFTTPNQPFIREARKREARKDAKDGQLLTGTRSASRAVSRATSATPAGTTPAPDGQPSRRPASRGKAASQEPQPSLAADRPRRASTARNTPAPEPRQPSKRTKRPAPGVISRTNSGGNSAVGKRKAAPKKKNARAQKKEKGEPADVEVEAEVEMEVEVDDEGNVIDPEEPRYCLCNRVSFGTMIQCDNENCKQEWFHLDCVDLAEIPARTTKWYCPDCRKLLNIGERGEVSARGIKM